ncbi:PREDICTED: uncharacterized protein LOC109319495 [Crocodylus porosus]|uniref:uncharacterized protein LOC109319495 n=1 Tax=Crocodylus porosus TaxID=8502 RepID=UPI00093D4E4C|nr:PREDICTED: uncharacterized protein LOC109319495 [Crocodylus porosus]
MAFLFRQFFLLTVDLMLASTFSCFLYAFACLIIALLICFVIFLSFRVVKKMERDIKGRAIIILVSNSSIGRTFTRNLDEAGFKVSATCWPPKEKRATVVKEECSPKMNVSQIHMTEDEYQKTVKNFIESHLSLKGTSDVKKNPSVLMWEEQEADKKEFSERKTTCRWKNVVLFPVYFIALLSLVVNCILVFLKKKILHFTNLLKFKNRQHGKQHVE